MQFREIKQHHLQAIISIAALFIVDLMAFCLAFLISENTGSEFVGIKYPIRVLILIIFLIYIFKRYNPAPTISRGHESKIIIKSLYLVGIGYIFYKILSKSISIDKAQYDLVFLHSFIFLDILFRLIVRSIQRFFLRQGLGGRRTVIVGKGEDAYHLADEINRNLSLGFTLIGYFNIIKSTNMDRYCPYLGTPAEISTYLTNHNIHEMIIVLDVHEHEKLLHIIGEFNKFDININIIPDMYEAISGQVSVDIIRGLPLLNINPDIMTEFQEIYKRAMDLCICIMALIMLFPVNLLIALIIRITSPGEILYKQIRVGLNGVQFTLIKFRTMYDNSEDNTGPIWSDKEDNRITGPGKILRKYHLDEMPQLLNVLFGTMSIIGPRPERPEIIENLMTNIPYYSRRFKVKPGLTGWAQIMGVYDVSVADVHNKLKHDFYYIENMSIFLDIKILILTLFSVLRGKGR